MFIAFDNPGGQEFLVRKDAIAAVLPAGRGGQNATIYLQAHLGGDHAGGLVLPVNEPYDSVKRRLGVI